MLDAMKAENSQSPTKGMRRVRRDQLEGVELQFETVEEKEARKTRVTAGKAAPATRKVAARQTKVQKENLENDDNFNASYTKKFISNSNEGMCCRLWIL